MKFTQAGSQTVTTAYKPASDSASGSGTLVITSPASVTSNSAAFTLTCGQALALTSNAPTTATVGTAYSGTVTVAGGKGTYTWAAVTGLPAGLKASGNGATLTISGTPTAAGAATVALSVPRQRDAAGDGDDEPHDYRRHPGHVARQRRRDNRHGRQGLLRHGHGDRGNGTYTWGAVTGLPAGLKASANGATLTISGTPTTAGTSTATVTARDTESTPKTATTSLTITVSAPALSITTGSLPTGTVGTAYSATLTATGGSGTATWSGSGLPAGLHDQLADRDDQRHADRVRQLPCHHYRHCGHDGICDDHPLPSTQ